MMKMRRITLGLLAGPLLLAGACNNQPIVLEDANNYDYDVDITLEAVQTVSGEDISVCWDQVSQDIRCHNMDPLTEVNNISLTRFSQLTNPDIESKLEADDLTQADLSGAVEYRPEDGEECVQLSEFGFFGTPVDVADEYIEDNGSYMLVLSTGDEVGEDSRMLLFLQPSSASTNNKVDVPNGCGTLDVDADLQSLRKVTVDNPEDGPWLVDWGGLTQTGLDNDLTLGNIDGLTLAHYSDLSVEDLEAQFLDIELIADELYTAELTAGSGIDLAEAKSGSKSFNGFTKDGLWLLALTCSGCQNPSPLFLTILDIAQ